MTLAATLAHKLGVAALVLVWTGLLGFLASAIAMHRRGMQIAGVVIAAGFLTLFGYLALR